MDDPLLLIEGLAASAGLVAYGRSRARRYRQSQDLARLKADVRQVEADCTRRRHAIHIATMEAKRAMIDEARWQTYRDRDAAARQDRRDPT